MTMIGVFSHLMCKIRTAFPSKSLSLSIQQVRICRYSFPAAGTDTNDQLQRREWSLQAPRTSQPSDYAFFHSCTELFNPGFCFL